MGLRRRALELNLSLVAKSECRCSGFSRERRSALLLAQFRSVSVTGFGVLKRNIKWIKEKHKALGDWAHVSYTTTKVEVGDNLPYKKRLQKDDRFSISKVLFYCYTVCIALLFFRPSGLFV